MRTSIHNLKLERYLDGECTPAEKIVFEEHLQTCRRCRMELAKFKRGETLLERHGTFTVSPSYDEEFRRRLRHALSFKPKRPDKVKPSRPLRIIYPLTLRKALAAAMIVFCIGFGTFYLGRAPSPRVRLAVGAAEEST